MIGVVACIVFLKNKYECYDGVSGGLLSASQVCMTMRRYKHSDNTSYLARVEASSCR